MGEAGELVRLTDVSARVLCRDAACVHMARLVPTRGPWSITGTQKTAHQINVAGVAKAKIERDIWDALLEPLRARVALVFLKRRLLGRHEVKKHRLKAEVLF